MLMAATEIKSDIGRLPMPKLSEVPYLARGND
jgi:hypothetical protein